MRAMCLTETYILQVSNIIIIFINCNCVITRWQWLYYMYTNVEKEVTRKKNYE